MTSETNANTTAKIANKETVMSELPFRWGSHPAVIASTPVDGYNAAIGETHSNVSWRCWTKRVIRAMNFKLTTGIKSLCYDERSKKRRLALDRAGGAIEAEICKDVEGPGQLCVGAR